MKKVGAYEAKTHLPRLLEEVRRGEQVVITRHGVAIAILSPAETPRDSEEIRRAVDALKDFRKDRTLGEDVRALIEEGRS